MPQSDSDDDGEAIEDLEFEARSSEAGDQEDEETLEVEGEDGTTEVGDEESSDDSEDEDGDEDEDDDEDQSRVQLKDDSQAQPLASTTVPLVPTLSKPRIVPEQRARSLSPAHARRSKLVRYSKSPRSYTVEAICAMPHPEPTHSLAFSMCMSHVITGSHDGYIRDYDIFSAVNGKNFLTAPQRHHCGVVEGTMKSGQLRTWWENPADPGQVTPTDDAQLSPVFSLLMHSDALWALAGTEQGHINLFTVRHEPGRFITGLRGHKGVVSSLSMQHDEKGFFSSGWDGDTLQWDLNTGQIVRKYNSHGAQVAVVSVRPLTAWKPPTDLPPVARPREDLSTPQERGQQNSSSADDDSKSDGSFDPLFDDEPEDDNSNSALIHPPQRVVQTVGQAGAEGYARPNWTVPKSSQQQYSRGPPTLDASSYAEYSPDVLLTASIDGQVVLWDQRVNTPGRGVGRLEMSDKTPPWCMSACWSMDGGQVYAGRRNGTVDVWDTRQFGSSVGGTPRLLKTLRNPLISGAVSCVVSFPDGHHIACASNDNIRLWNAKDTGDQEPSTKSKSGVQFKIIPGHHGGQISQMIVDPGSRFMVTASSNRGWHGDSTKTVLVHDIKRNEY